MGKDRLGMRRGPVSCELRIGASFGPMKKAQFECRRKRYCSVGLGSCSIFFLDLFSRNITRDFTL
jgi:hypothetical protein